jgi:hypothetical protein
MSAIAWNEQDMEKASSAVLKKHQVRLTESPPAGSPPAVGVATPRGGGARIVHIEASHAVVEVLCPCGNKIHVRCEWPVQEAAQSVSAETGN